MCEAAVAVMRLKALPTTFSQTSKLANEEEDAEGLKDDGEHAMAMLDPAKIYG